MRSLRYDGARSLRALYVRRRILNSAHLLCLLQAPSVRAARSGPHHLQTGPRGPISRGPEGALGGESPVGSPSGVHHCLLFPQSRLPGSAAPPRKQRCSGRISSDVSHEHLRFLGEGLDSSTSSLDNRLLRKVQEAERDTETTVFFGP